MKFHISTIIILLLFSGCSQHVPIPKKITNNEKKVETVAFPRIDQYNVPVKYKSDNIIADSKTYQLILSNYRIINDTIDRSFDSIFVKDFNTIVKTDNNSSKKSVIYSVTIESMFCSNKIKITRNYSVKKTKLAYLVSVESPSLIEISDSDAGLCSSNKVIKGIIKSSEKSGFFADSALLLTGLLDTKGALNRPLSAIKGELNSNFSKESVLGNLNRILGKNKNDIYKISTNGTNYFVKIKVYPYKNGSKVVWSSTETYNVPYYPFDDFEKYLSEKIKKNMKEIKNVNQKIIEAIKS